MIGYVYVDVEFMEDFFVLFLMLGGVVGLFVVFDGVLLFGVLDYLVNVVVDYIILILLMFSFIS